MARRFVHEIDGKEVVHFEAPGGRDCAHCGRDLVGDDVGTSSWTAGRLTTRPVNCPDCIAIVELVWTIKKKDMM